MMEIQNIDGLKKGEFNEDLQDFKMSLIRFKAEKPEDILSNNKILSNKADRLFVLR